MTEDQKKKLSESTINKALVLAYAGLTKFAEDTKLDLDDKSIRFESIKANKDDNNLWNVTLSYTVKHKEAPKTAFEAIYMNQRKNQIFTVNPTTQEVISVEQI